MAGWTRAKREIFERSFYIFLNHCFINSKDKGQICLGENLYEGQRRLITEILDALENDVHRIYVLKSRQLGISTLIRALSVFYIGVHKGLKGALLFDTTPHRESARAELVSMIRDLPAKLKFPKARGAGEGNRDSISFVNDSSILFLSAGVKRSKGSGTLGRSTGLSMHHASEICSFENPDGMEAFEQSLSDSNPDRLYIYESTARGFNYWWEVYTAAKKDPVHCKCIFLGFWAKESQRIERDSIDWALYGTPPLTQKEQEKIEKVRQDYGVQISIEQWAWFRRRMDPTARQEGDASPEFEGSTLKLQEQCVVEEDAWQQTGSIFFPAEKLTEITHKYVEPRFSTFMFLTGAEFADMKVIAAPNTKNIDLKVWEEPDPEGYYCVGVDPAFGENPNNDRSSIQVLRCYADGVDQVAEYASPLPSTHQFAWVVASILGWYGSNNAQVRYALELNGPGTAVFSELRSLKHQIETGYQAKSIEEKGLKDVFRNVRTLIYNRADSIGVGKNYHIKCLAVDTPLPTPDGWKLIGDVRAGERVFDERGKPCRVRRVSNVKRHHKCYRVKFDDGSSIVADAQHLWEVRGSKEALDKEARIVTTKELTPGRDFIPVTKPLVLPKVQLSIHPYILGLWLGDGYSSGGRFCAHADDIGELGRNIRACGMKLGKRGHGRTMEHQNIIGLHQTLRLTNLKNNKHIPAEYLRASFEQRLALLQGLMDTDGTINPKNGRQCAFVTTNSRLAEGFSELATSLGIKAKHHTFKPKLLYKGKQVDCALAYFFYFTAYADLPVFRLKRKLKHAKVIGATRWRRSRRYAIVSVKAVKSVPVKCIEVDSPSHLYLAGKGMVATHNTNTSLKIMFMERMRDFVVNDKFRIRSVDLLDEMKTIAREGDSIKAPGTMKDDRVLAAAFAIYCWETGPRKQLVMQNRTREAEKARKTLSITDQVYLFQQNQLSQFFATKVRDRVQAQRMAVRQSWRYR